MVVHVNWTLQIRFTLRACPAVDLVVTFPAENGRTPGEWRSHRWRLCGATAPGREHGRDA